MSTIRERINKAGETTYQAIVRINGHEPRRKTFTKLKQATEWAEATATVLRSLTSNTPNPNKFKRTLLRDAIDEYFSWSHGTKSFHPHLKSVRLRLGAATLGMITKSYLSAYVDRMKNVPTQFGRPHTEATLAKHLSSIRAVLKRQGEIHNVEPDLRGLGSELLSDDWDRERDRILSASEEAGLRKEMHGPNYSEQWLLLLDLTLETGARQAELVMCPHSEFHLTEKIWIIPAHRTKAKKTRQVPLSRKALTAVQRLHDMLNERNQKLRVAAPQSEPESRLFWQFQNENSVCTAFHKITKKLQLHDFRFHDLRHTAITRMVLHKRKLSVYEIMRIVGHESMSTFNRYANLRGGDLVDRMD